jgi:hypothetical protein
MLLLSLQRFGVPCCPFLQGEYEGTMNLHRREAPSLASRFKDVPYHPLTLQMHCNVDIPEYLLSETQGMSLFHIGLTRSQITGEHWLTVLAFRSACGLPARPYVCLICFLHGHPILALRPDPRLHDSLIEVEERLIM